MRVLLVVTRLVICAATSVIQRLPRLHHLLVTGGLTLGVWLIGGATSAFAADGPAVPATSVVGDVLDTVRDVTNQARARAESPPPDTADRANDRRAGAPADRRSAATTNRPTGVAKDHSVRTVTNKVTDKSIPMTRDRLSRSKKDHIDRIAERSSPRTGDTKTLSLADSDRRDSGVAPLRATVTSTITGLTNPAGIRIADSVAAGRRALSADHTARAVELTDRRAVHTGTPAMDVRSHTGQVPGLPSPIAGLTDQVSGLTAPVLGLTAPVLGLTDQVPGLAAPIAGLTDQISGLTAPVLGLTNQISGLTAPVLSLAISTVEPAAGSLSSLVSVVSETAAPVVANLGQPQSTSGSGGLIGGLLSITLLVDPSVLSDAPAATATPPARGWALPVWFGPASASMGATIQLTASFYDLPARPKDELPTGSRHPMKPAAPASGDPLGQAPGHPSPTAGTDDVTPPWEAHVPGRHVSRWTDPPPSVRAAPDEPAFSPD